MSDQDVRNYFKITDNSAAYHYQGNPDLTGGKDIESITLDDLGINRQLVKNELLGMDQDLTDPITGKPYPDDFYDAMIERAVSLAEKTFDVVILPRVQVDRLDYHRNDFNAFSYLQTNLRPILTIKDVLLYYNNQDILHIPSEWIKASNRTGQLQVSPSIFMEGLNTTITPTLYPIFNSPYDMSPTPYQNMEYAPQMLGVTYVAGMMPHTGRTGVNYDYMIQPDMLSYVAKLAAQEIISKWSRNIIGSGIASYSVAVDGISTNLNTTASAENSAATAEVAQLDRDLKRIREHLADFYGSPEVSFIN